MSTTVSTDKVRLDADEIALVVEGLDAGYVMYSRLAEDAHRFGFAEQARDFSRRAAQFRALSEAAGSVSVDRITVRFS